MSLSEQNPLGILGVDFVEYAGPDQFNFSQLFARFGFKQTSQSVDGNKIYLFQQGQIRFVLNNSSDSFAQFFAKAHGPSICSTGFIFENAQVAFDLAISRGAKPFQNKKEQKALINVPTVYGIGDSLIYFLDSKNINVLYKNIFGFSGSLPEYKGQGLDKIDHFTNNVPKGDMQKWCDFYSQVFGFKDVRYFDIKGKQTGLQSKVMRSPCGTFSIPINEPTESKSQIQEYLDEYHGSGIQHLALTTVNIIKTLDDLKTSHIEFLSPPPSTYYEMLKDRLPNVKEEVGQLQNRAILADGDHDGYLLQIFTKNIIGPIFFEIIQRQNHFGFGEGNFQALFDAIERDQQLRGYL